jgi:tetratricopeptide (TPR) repeat protein
MNYLKFHFLIPLFQLFMIVGYSQNESVDKIKENAQQAREFLQMQVLRNDQQLFQTAQSYIRKNRYDAAIPVLEDLLIRNPQNATYYEWLLRSHLTVSQLDQADSLVNAMLLKYPQDLRYSIDRATILYRQNHEKEALSLWHQILQSHPRNINLYSQIANEMIENRLWDEAVIVYQTAIEKIPNTEHFYMNLANLYKNRLMYKEATDNYLKYLDAQPKQEKYIFNQILAFQIPTDQQTEFFTVLEKQAASSDTTSRLTVLLGQLYQRYRKYDKALETFLSLETESSDGTRLISFAQAAERDSAYAIALQAYQEVIKRYPKSKHILLAYRGEITTLFLLAVTNNQIQYAEQALRLIDTVKTHFPRHPETYRLAYFEGKFYFSYYFDVDKALAIFSEILQEKSLPANLRNDILLDKGKCEIMRGELEQSIKTFEAVKDLQYKGKALLLCAEVGYFLYDWTLSKEYINTLLKTQGMGSNVTNDAIALQLKLSYAEKNPEILSKMAKAELLVYQQKKSEARREFTELIKMPNIPPTLKSESYLAISRLSLDLDETETGLEYSRMAISDSSVYLYADEHLYLMGVVLETRLNQPERAFDIYRNLLENYPNSLMVDDVRDRMRKIRDQREPELP